MRTLPAVVVFVGGYVIGLLHGYGLGFIDGWARAVLGLLYWQ